MKARGFTLLEAVFVLAVLGVVLGVAVPSYAAYLARQQLRHTAELLELDLRRARTLSVEEGRAIFVSFNSGTDWCWGLSHQQPCNCGTGQPRCDLGGQSASEHKGTLLQAGQGVTFEPGLGRPQGWSRIGLSNTRNQQLHLDLNPLGRPQVCGPDARRGNSC